MKIAHFCPYDIFRHGGVQRHIKDLSACLNSRGHETWAIAAESKAENTYDQLFLVGKSLKIGIDKTQSDITFADRKDISKIKQFLIQQNFDVIHFHTPWNPFITWQLMNLFKGKKVATFHNTPTDTLSGRVMSYIFRSLSFMMVKHFNAIIVPSASPLAHLKIPDGKAIHIIPPCFDVQKYVPKNNRINKDYSYVEILFIGRFEERKGIFDLIKAYRGISNMRGLPKIRLTLVGSGPLEAKVNQLINTWALENIEIFHNVGEPEKIDLLQRADIFCAPAISGESFGLVIVEAMAAGLPVVAYNNPGYRQVLNEEAENCLAISGNVDDLTDKLLAFIKDADLREKLSDWGTFTSMQYDVTNQVDKYIDIYNK